MLATVKKFQDNGDFTNLSNGTTSQFMLQILNRVLKCKYSEIKIQNKEKQTKAIQF